MILIGRYLSPFVRRVGATLIHYGFDFEQRPIRAAGAEQDEIRRSNPLGRVPALVLDDGEVLADSAVALEYLDDLAGPERALVPARGPERFRLLSDLAIAAGACEKAIAVYGEMRNRPEDKRHPESMDGASRQARDGFEHLDRGFTGPWCGGERMSQLDVSLICYWDFVKLGTPEVAAGARCPNIDALCARTADMPMFRDTAPGA